MFNLNRRNIYKDDNYAFTTRDTIRATSQGVRLSNVYPSNFQRNFTFEFDYMSRVINLSSMLFSFYVGTNQNDRITIGISTTQLNFQYLNSSGTLITYTIANNPPLNQNNKIVISFSADSLLCRAMFNGVYSSRTVVNISNKPISPFEGIGIAQSNGDANYRGLSGYIRNVRIFDSFFTENEIRQIYGAGNYVPSEALDSVISASIVNEIRLNQLNGIPVDNITKEKGRVINYQSSSLIQKGNAWQPI